MGSSVHFLTLMQLPAQKNTQKRINRHTYKKNKEIKLGRTLPQLILISVKSFNNHQATFSELQCILARINIQVSRFVLKRTLHSLRLSGHLTYTGTKFIITGKRLTKKRSKRNKKTPILYLKVRKLLCTQASKMEKERLVKIEKKVMNAVKDLYFKDKKRGVVFNQIKAKIQSKKSLKYKNSTIVKVLEKLRGEKRLVLKKGRNYLTKAELKPKQNKVKKSKKSLKKVQKKPKKPRKNAKIELKPGKKCETKTEPKKKKSAKASKLSKVSKAKTTQSNKTKTKKPKAVLKQKKKRSSSLVVNVSRSGYPDGDNDSEIDELISMSLAEMEDEMKAMRRGK